jgi:phosphoribosylaminoimidazole-succinocarboxamide synthase
MSRGVLLTTDLPGIPLFRRGKVRDVYDLGESLLVVSTDRISAFDVILPNGIPDKGRVLNSISVFWFSFLGGVIPNHFLTADVGKFPQRLKPFAEILEGRSMLVKKAQALPVECVVRGYLAGSGWKEYLASQTVCGISLPKGLRESEKLDQPLFTPSTKADVGHDLNVSQSYVEKALGSETAAVLKKVSLALYSKAAEYALSKGIIIADTKFEFGRQDGGIILIDEVLSPDSSRFWPKAEYRPGGPQPSFDKQFVRDYLERIAWDKTPPAPSLPQEIIDKTAEKYRDAYLTLTGMPVCRQAGRP